MLYNHKCWFYFIFWTNLSTVQESEKQFFALLSRVTLKHFTSCLMQQMRIFWCFLLFLIEEILGLRQVKPPQWGESWAVPSQGRAQVRELQVTPELTHRQLLSTPCTTGSCLNVTTGFTSNPLRFPNFCFSLHRRGPGASKAAAELLLSLLLLFAQPQAAPSVRAGVSRALCEHWLPRDSRVWG